MSSSFTQMSSVMGSSGGAAPTNIPYAVVGVVVENVDPEDRGRVKVKFPSLEGSPVSDWAPVCGLGMQKEFGLYIIPEIDDQMLVVFLNGDMDHPMVLAGLWSSKHPPQSEAISGITDGNKPGVLWSSAEYSEGTGDISKNDRRLWKSRSGAMIGFDDTDGSETVHIWDKNRTMSMVFNSSDDCLMLSNTKGDLHIRTEGDLYLEAKGEVKMSSKTANITLDAKMNYELKTGVDMKATVGANATIDATGNMTYKSGGLGNVEAGGILTLKGAMIKLN